MQKTSIFKTCLFLAAAFSAALGPMTQGHAATAPIIVGLDADMSSGSAPAGEAIRRGAILAIREINSAGGVLGRPLKLVVRDHKGNPARGLDNIEDFAKDDNLVAVIGGLHTPVALHELEAIHRLKIIYLGPWAAGTPVVDNGHAPNFVFRVSVRDQYAGGYLVGHAKNKGYRKIGLLLERTGWGRSNEKAMRSAIERHGLRQVGIEWFNWGVRDLSKQINNLVVAGAEAVLLVANAREGAVAVRAMAGRSSSSRVPVISHWGITGGNFPEIVGTDLDKVDLQFLQTFSFISPPYPDRAKKVFAAYRKAFAGVDGPEDVFSPVGTAHAYDLVHLLAAAIRKAGTTDRSEVRDALEQLDRYEGLVRDYDPPFTPLRHDALTTADFRMATFADGGAIVPIGE